jgi:hypothetical protein
MGACTVILSYMRINRCVGSTLNMETCTILALGIQIADRNDTWRQIDPESIVSRGAVSDVETGVVGAIDSAVAESLIYYNIGGCILNFYAGRAICRCNACNTPVYKCANKRISGLYVRFVFSHTVISSDGTYRAVADRPVCKSRSRRPCSRAKLEAIPVGRIS